MKLYSKAFNLVCLLICATGAFSSCSDSTDVKSHNWQLVWSDEFNTMTSDSLPDPEKWSYDIGNGSSGWGNNELEYYTNRTQNIKLDSIDGVQYLKITARSESYSGYSYTSARIKTKGLYSTQYGRIEARIKLPYGPGIWPAFWMLGSNIDSAPWPQCGEIDIMEYKGYQPYLIYGSVHSPSASDSTTDAYITQEFGYTSTRLDNDYHIYAVEWSSTAIDFYLDNILYREVTPTDLSSVGGTWVFNNPFYIILNLAVGGDFVGSPNSNTTFPQTMLVDYVRVYKDASSS